MSLPDVVALHGHKRIKCPRAKGASQPRVLPTNPREILIFTVSPAINTEAVEFSTMLRKENILPGWGSRSG